MPSPNLHALFLVRHMVEHFASAGMTLRQILDWAFFVEKHTKIVDWKWLLNVLEEYHMKDFLGIVNAICVDDLGFDATNIFPTSCYDSEMKERVFKDVLYPEFSGKEPYLLYSRIIFKYRRWKANEWKHRLCYNESMWSAFWSGVWAKILKPASI